MHHWKGTDPADPSAPQLTMYWGRLGSRPWYKISAGTCSTSSSPWCQERPENHIPEELPPAPWGMNPRAGYPQLLPQTPLPQRTPSPAKQTTEPPKKTWQDQMSPAPSPGSQSPSPHSLQRAGSAGTPLPCAPVPQQWTCTCAAGGQDRVTTAPSAAPSLLPPSLSQG